MEFTPILLGMDWIEKATQYALTFVCAFDFVVKRTKFQRKYFGNNNKKRKKLETRVFYEKATS